MKRAEQQKQTTENKKRVLLFLSSFFGRLFDPASFLWAPPALRWPRSTSSIANGVPNNAVAFGVANDALAYRVANGVADGDANNAVAHGVADGVDNNADPRCRVPPCRPIPSLID